MLLTQYYLKWTNSSSINNCNTEHRFDDYCMKNWWDSKSYDYYVYYVSLVNNWALIQEADECALEVWASDFYTKSAYVYHGSSGSILAVGLLALLLN